MYPPSGAGGSPGPAGNARPTTATSVPGERHGPTGTIPEELRDLFEKETIAHLATLTSEGWPHASPVWIDYDPDADRLLVNSERGRRKVGNVEADPRVSVSTTDPDAPYRRMTVQGTVDRVTEDGAREHVDELSRRYSGTDYPHPIETARVILEIRPDQGVAEGYVGDRRESDLRTVRFRADGRD